jgi:hypothetical protein
MGNLEAGLANKTGTHLTRTITEPAAATATAPTPPPPPAPHRSEGPGADSMSCSTRMMAGGTAYGAAGFELASAAAGRSFKQAAPAGATKSAPSRGRPGPPAPYKAQGPGAWTGVEVGDNGWRRPRLRCFL